LLKFEPAVSVAESAHNLTLYVPEIALLGCVRTRHIPSIAAVIAVVAGAAMVFFGRRGAKA